MAAAILNQDSFCWPICAHVDCKANRMTVYSKCRICSEEIGTGKRFYREDAGNYVHAVCLEKEISKEGK